MDQEREGGTCEHCGQAAELRTCERCGREEWLIDCGHYDQPRPIAANGEGHDLCDDCAAKMESLKAAREKIASVTGQPAHVNDVPFVYIPNVEVCVEDEHVVATMADLVEAGFAPEITGACYDGDGHPSVILTVPV